MKAIVIKADTDAANKLWDKFEKNEPIKNRKSKRN